MEITTKDFPVIAGEATEEYPYGSFEVILSAPTLDRDGEVIDSRAFEPLPDHITFDTDHSMTCDSVVGSGVPYYAEDGTLRVKGGYASDERSQTIRQKVAEKHIRTTSVTFMSGKRVKDEKGVDHVVSGELLNGTFTPIPSNRESVVVTAKSIVDRAKARDAAVDEKVGARNSASDAEKIQSMHDTAADLGANCAGANKSAAGAERKDAAEPDDNPGTLAQSVDAALDQAMVLLAGIDTATLPNEVAEAIALLVAADAAVDELLIVMGVNDPDEEDQTADDAAGAAAEAAAPAAKSAVTPPEILARLAITENAARFAFGA